MDTLHLDRTATDATSAGTGAGTPEIIAEDDARAWGHRQQAWSAWLHGSVAAVHEEDHLLLIVPVPTLQPSAVSLARRLHEVGSVTLLD